MLLISNMGQLAVHLLVSSSGARRVAYLDEPSVLPCTSNDAFRSDAIGDLALALEGWLLFSNDPQLLRVEKDHVVILSSLYSGKRRVINASSCNEDGSDPKCENLGWKQKLEEYDPSQQSWIDPWIEAEAPTQQYLDESMLIKAEELVGAPGTEGMSSAEAKKVVSAAKLSELALVDPKGAKRCDIYRACVCSYEIFSGGVLGLFVEVSSPSDSRVGDKDRSKVKLY
ncbi:hypothetical protein GUJ93_ZPchr0012g22108 [Zizania palustris]|uniref:Uncharacterized protein n=1 Tax=Zizania palustris TaxID=103762 RepID=A0A8J6BVM9_ZIZPA|nr:hypothetical protein GUJ93_ZPchr0012g22108 [Zizania palustris]